MNFKGTARGMKLNRCDADVYLLFLCAYPVFISHNQQIDSGLVQVATQSHNHTSWLSIRQVDWHTAVYSSLHYSIDDRTELLN